MLKSAALNIHRPEGFAFNVFKNGRMAIVAAGILVQIDSEGMRKIQTPNLSNGTIAVTLQELGYLGTEDLVIEQQTAQI